MKAERLFRLIFLGISIAELIADETTYSGDDKITSEARNAVETYRRIIALYGDDVTLAALEDLRRLFKWPAP